MIDYTGIVLTTLPANVATDRRPVRAECAEQSYGAGLRWVVEQGGLDCLIDPGTILSMFWMEVCMGTTTTDSLVGGLNHAGGPRQQRWKRGWKSHESRRKRATRERGGKDIVHVCRPGMHGDNNERCAIVVFISCMPMSTPKNASHVRDAFASHVSCRYGGRRDSSQSLERMARALVAAQPARPHGGPASYGVPDQPPSGAGQTLAQKAPVVRAHQGGPQG